MKIFIIVVAVILVLIIELVISRRGAKHITAEVISDKNTAEPDEKITLTVKITNESMGIYPFLRYTVCFPKEVEVHSSQRSFQSPPNLIKVTETAVLLPHRSIEKKIVISIPKRGTYRMGQFTVEAGDFLGMKEYSKAVSIFQAFVIYPRPAEDIETEKVLGGIMGDFSVRRYIFEDPVLISGFREYTGREPMKSISWLQSARTGNLMVKKYDFTSQMSVSVVLDTDGTDDAAAERCFSVARSICDGLEKNGLEYDFSLNADLSGVNCGQHYFAKGQGSRHLYGILSQLGQAEYTCSLKGPELLKRFLESGAGAPGVILIMPKENETSRYMISMFDGNPMASVFPVYAGEVDECR